LPSSIEQKGSRSPLHNRLRPIHFINPESIRGCQPLQVTCVSLQNCNVWQDKFLDAGVFLRLAGTTQETGNLRGDFFCSKGVAMIGLIPHVGLSIYRTVGGLFLADFDSAVAVPRQCGQDAFIAHFAPAVLVAETKWRQPRRTRGSRHNYFRRFALALLRALTARRV
jgi:hypothetical protein